MRRNTKTMYEWRKVYRDKEELMLERGFPEVSPHEFYRDLFPEGSLQSAEHDGKGNVIATQIRPSGKGRTKQWVIDDSLNMLDKVIGDEFGLIPPITFYGKTHTKQNAHELYAVAIDIDYVGKQQLKNLLKQFGNGVQLRPTYLVSSGKGVHAYYFLKEPVQLYHNLEDTLAELKEAFIRRYSSLPRQEAHPALDGLQSVPVLRHHCSAAPVPARRSHKQNSYVWHPSISFSFHQ